MGELIQSRLEKAGLSRVAADLLAHSKTAIHITRTATEEEGMRLGASRLGGSADLPTGEAWPSGNDGPMSFVAQIDLAELRSFDVDRHLPEVGTMLFFYDTTRRQWGFDPADRGSWRVFYRTDTSDLRRTPAPNELPELSRTYPCAASFSNSLTLPPARSLTVEEVGLSDEELQGYRRLLQDDARAIAPDHHLLGHPSAIQGDMQLQCQLVTNGVYCGDRRAYEDPRRAALEEGAADWQLLLQIDSDEWASMMWGDHGRIYFWVHRDDLRALNFDNVWTILQC